MEEIKEPIYPMVNCISDFPIFFIVLFRIHKPLKISKNV